MYDKNKTDFSLECKIHQKFTRNNNKISNKSALCSPDLTNIQNLVTKGVISNRQARQTIRKITYKEAPPASITWKPYRLRQAPAARLLQAKFPINQRTIILDGGAAALLPPLATRPQRKRHCLSKR